MTFLELINAVLREVNEVELTTIGSSRGIQTSVKDFINKSQRDIINSEQLADHEALKQQPIERPMRASCARKRKL